VELPLLLPRTLALLLAKSGSFKGDYMARNPYLIGRLLSLVDKLHWNYCRTEREGDVPPQLLGNSLMSAALDNPVSGLARLSERLPLYLRNIPLWLREEVAAVEREIDKEKLPIRCTDEDRAQMLLGYLARPEREELKTDSPPPPTGEKA
jgi:hypothetical protein